MRDSPQVRVTIRYRCAVVSERRSAERTILLVTSLVTRYNFLMHGISQKALRDSWERYEDFEGKNARFITPKDLAELTVSTDRLLDAGVK